MKALEVLCSHNAGSDYHPRRRCLRALLHGAWNNFGAFLPGLVSGPDALVTARRLVPGLHSTSSPKEAAGVAAVSAVERSSRSPTGVGRRIWHLYTTGNVAR